MPWSIQQKPGCPYVEGVFTDVTSWQEIKEMTEQCIALQKEKGITKFLIQTTDMRPTATVTEVFELPASEYQKQHVDRQTQIAVVYSPSGASEDLVKFYETACVNRGWRARSFTEEQEAIAWLVGDGSP